MRRVLGSFLRADLRKTKLLEHAVRALDCLLMVKKLVGVLRALREATRIVPGNLRRLHSINKGLAQSIQHIAIDELVLRYRLTLVEETVHVRVPDGRLFNGLASIGFFIVCILVRHSYLLVRRLLRLESAVVRVCRHLFILIISVLDVEEQLR